jgi:hypothetical protein
MCREEKSSRKKLRDAPSTPKHMSKAWQFTTRSPGVCRLQPPVVQYVRPENPPVPYAGSPMDQHPESTSCAHVWMLRNEAVLLCTIADDYFISTACDVHIFFLRKDHFVSIES